MQMYKMRVIAYHKSKEYPVFGITVPSDIAIFEKNTYFKVEKSGSQIIFTSGTLPTYTKEEIKNYEFEDCTI